MRSLVPLANGITSPLPLETVLNMLSRIVLFFFSGDWWEASHSSTGLPASLPKSRVVSGLIGSSGIGYSSFSSLSSATCCSICIFKSTSLSFRASRSRFTILISESFSLIIHRCPSTSSFAALRSRCS